MPPKKKSVAKKSSKSHSRRRLSIIVFNRNSIPPHRSLQTMKRKSSLILSSISLSFPHSSPLPPSFLQAFKTRALKIQKALPTFTINAVKPTRGNFVITVNGKEVVALKGLKRPFPALKALDIEDVIEKVKAAMD
ncbi:hypothetical protein TrST_g1387 [Triparma strigata]|uniref:Selenoprotein H n=1 Tax=Triparma strigata TaxID=1606541 RepID=A0A9W7E7V0_9STRA|nr:hypothetical protein TrST_g1387 [Triparma strigata]